MRRAVETAQKKSKKTGGEGAVEKTTAVAEKDVAVTDEVRSLAEVTPATAETALSAGSDTGVPAAETVTEPSQKVENLATKVAEATTAKTDVKVHLIDYSTQLTSERTALTDRLKLVLDKLEQKGGDPKEYRLYIASIGGVKIDVTDKTATWARIKYWATADEGGLRWARNVGIFLSYILGSVVLAWIVRLIIRRLMGVGQVSSHLFKDFLVAMSGRVIVFIGALLGLSALEVNLPPLLAVIGAAGFVIAFALQGTLSNFASGLLIMVNKPFDVNDEVDVGGVKGQVAAVSIFNTLIQTEDGLKMIVPNNSIWNGVIVNHTTRMVSNPTASEAKPA
jgi:small conductance mechanosensitive channel